jgi:hypothetical protein
MSKSIAIAYSMKKKKKKEYKEKDKSERDKGVHSGYQQESRKGKSVAGELVRGAKEEGKDKWASKMELAKTLHEQNLEDLKADKKDRKNLAEGGSVDPMQEVTCPQCSHSFSHGGQVANDTDFTADTLPNEFDDLVLRDDEEMEGYTGKNSGDLIGRAMAKRKAKKA